MCVNVSTCPVVCFHADLSTQLSTIVSPYRFRGPWAYTSLHALSTVHLMLSATAAAATLVLAGVLASVLALVVVVLTVVVLVLVGAALFLNCCRGEAVPSGGAEGCCSHAAPRPECRLPIPLHGSVADALQRTVMRPWGPSSQIRVPGHEHDTNDKLQEMLITMLRGTSPQGSDAHEPPSLTPHGRKRWSFTCWNIVCGRPA